MARRNIYVRDGDEALWQEAEAVAGPGGLSALLATVLREYVIKRKKRDGALETITVELMDREGRIREKVFRGRWLVGREAEMRTGEPAYDAGACYQVAETAKGQIAVHVYHCNHLWASSFEVYPDLEEARKDHLPADIADAVESELTGRPMVEVLDI